MHTISRILILFLFCLPISSLAQDTIKTWVDTTKFSVFGREAGRSSSDYIHSIEKAMDILNKVQNDAQPSLSIQNIAQEVISDDSAIKMMQRALRNRSSIGMRNMQMYREILLEIQNQVLSDREKLNRQNAKLELLDKEMMQLTRDKMLVTLMNDSEAFLENKSRLRRLQRKWRRADSLVQTGLDTVNYIRTEAADNAIAISEMLNRINSRLRRTGISAMGKEYNYLWEADSGKTKEKDKALTKNTLQSRQKVMNYYLQQRINTILVFALCFGLFLWWVAKAYNYLYRNDEAHVFGNLNLNYLNISRVAAAIVAVFCFIPFFDIYAPSSFTEIIELIIIIALSFMLWKKWPRKLFIYWMGLAFIFACFFIFSNPEPDNSVRWILLLLNIASIIVGIQFMRNIEGDTLLQRLVKIVTVIHILLNVGAMFCNLYGRITLAQTLRNSGIYGLTQIVALAVCLQILKEAVLLQIQSSRIRRGIKIPFDTSHVNKSLNIPLVIVISILWLVMFSVNMNIYDPLKKVLVARLTNPVSIGSASFTVGSVVLFFIIIWIAHLLQRYMGYIFGDIGHDDDNVNNKEQRSKLLMSKLIILTLGYFLAVAASGLPIDKITIVLGALGVGIGLGLQNIVSNFISGIVLIFDRPIQIGDSIELGNKAGKVREIGMRSSTLLTPEGAEIIIPNGDILSQQITNWTLSNNYKRLELSFLVVSEVEKDTIVAAITSIINESEYAYKEREPVVLIEGIKEGEISFKTFFWCNDIYRADQVKSEMRFLLYRELKEQGIQMK